MLTHYLRVAFRTFGRNKLYSLINISCLSIGLAAAMTILLYVLHEHSYDRWQANADRIFNVSVRLKAGNSTIYSNRVSYTAAPLVQQADGNVESYIRVNIPFQKPVLQNPVLPDAMFTVEKPFLFADAGFFRFFSFRLLEGNPDQVLTRPYTVVLTATAAQKYFGNSDPVGKILLYNKDYRLEVTGVCADPPSNSTIDFDCVASGSSMASIKEIQGSLKSAGVQGGSFLTWLRLKDAATAGKVEQTFHRLAAGAGPDPGNNKDAYMLTALPEVHLHNNFGDASNTRYLKIFPLVAGLILLLALINYMSLATARAAARAKEIGVRKVMGAGRRMLAAQFYAESTFYALVSFFTGVLLFLLLRPAFLNLLQLKIDNRFLFSPPVLGSFGLLLLVVILISGSYPSLVLSAFRPVAVLYGKLSRQRGAERIRKFFLVIQFTISMALILCSLMIQKQLFFIRHTDTGIDRDNVVMVSFDKHLPHYTAFKRTVEELPGVALAATAHYPMYRGYDAFFTGTPGKQMMMPVMTVDQQFIPLLGLKWEEESRVDPVGQTFRFDDNYSVAGVLKDFNYQTLQEPVGPLCLFVSRDTASAWGTEINGCLFVKIRPHVNLPTLLGGLKKIYAQYDRQTPFSYQFLDDAFDSQYKAEDRLAGLFGIFTGITIVIACLGLFALATFAAEQRLKEIGIRKVLGASIASIGALLSWDLLRPVLVSVVIASPLSWWIMHRWLQDFAYRTEFSWWVFPLAGGALLLVALCTVLFRAMGAARVNPVNNLRSE